MERRKLYAAALEGVMSSQFAMGGIAVVLAGIGVTMTRKIGKACYDAVFRQLVLSAEFNSRDDSFRWIISWLSEHPAVSDGKQFAVFTSLRYLGPAGRDLDRDEKKEDVYLLPTGWTMIRHKKHWLVVSREQGDEKSGGSPKERETLTIYIIGGSKEELLSIVRESRLAYEAKEKSRTSIFVADEYSSWNKIASRISRPLDSVVIWPPERAQWILNDCVRFMQAEEWYASRGIPWRRGYLLYGPPGTGKTSLVSALAGELKLPIYVVSLSSSKLTDDSFAELLNGSAPRCILLLEDVDAAFRDRHAKNASGGLTFSGLLNAIDGVAAQEGRLLFMTTNHRELLDPALIRPGRVDVDVRFDRCAKEQVGLYVRSFFRDITDDEVDAFVEAVPSGTLSIAQLQACLLRHRDSPPKALAELRTLLSSM